MFCFDSTWWFPDNEHHVIDNMVITDTRVDGRLAYQYHKYASAMKQVYWHSVAVDVGAHVGLWTYWLRRDFRQVFAFEPAPENIECWTRNIPQDRVTLYPVALGAAAGRAGLARHGCSSAHTCLVDGMDVMIHTLDSYRFPEVNFLKIDCEGYEAFIIEGAKETITRCRPVILVEQKDGGGKRYHRGDTDAVTLLKSLGGKQHWNAGGDYCFTFPRVD